MGNPSEDNSNQQTKQKTLVTEVAYFKIEGLRTNEISKFPTFSIYLLVKLNQHDILTNGET